MRKKCNKPSELIHRLFLFSCVEDYRIVLHFSSCWESSLNLDGRIYSEGCIYIKHFGEGGSFGGRRKKSGFDEFSWNQSHFIFEDVLHGFKSLQLSPQLGKWTSTRLEDVLCRITSLFGCIHNFGIFHRLIIFIFYAFSYFIGMLHSWY